MMKWTPVCQFIDSNYLLILNEKLLFLLPLTILAHCWSCESFNLVNLIILLSNDIGMPVSVLRIWILLLLIRYLLNSTDGSLYSKNNFDFIFIWWNSSIFISLVFCLALKAPLSEANWCASNCFHVNVSINKTKICVVLSSYTLYQVYGRGAKQFFLRAAT